MQTRIHYHKIPEAEWIGEMIYKCRIKVIVYYPGVRPREKDVPLLILESHKRVIELQNGFLLHASQSLITRWSQKCLFASEDFDDVRTAARPCSFFFSSFSVSLSFSLSLSLSLSLPPSLPPFLPPFFP
jgi:hypothetical protein